MSTFLTDLDLDADGRRIRRPLRFEDATFEYDPDGPTPLPTDINGVLEGVLKVMPFNSNGARAVWRRCFRSAPSRALVQDMFWHIFEEQLSPPQGGDEQSANAEAARLLFARMGDNYVRLVGTVPPEMRDAFFDRYFDALAQAVYLGLCEAYPKSRSHFDDGFKRMLLDNASSWCTGMHQSKPQLAHWAAAPGSSSGGGGSRGGGSRGGGGGGGAAGGLAATLGGAAGGASAAPRTWARSVRKTHTLAYSPFVEKFLEDADDRHRRTITMRISLTETPGRAVVPLSAANAEREKKTKTISSRSGAIGTFKQRRNEILHEYQGSREATLRKIAGIRKQHTQEQELMKMKGEKVIRGDVHEYSNYLVSLLNNNGPSRS